MTNRFEYKTNGLLYLSGSYLLLVDNYYAYLYFYNHHIISSITSIPVIINGTQIILNLMT